jgi:lipid II:glycine glycyltransferase (peptidoglycan interpeptide bridge formation enzyme)
VRKARKEVVVRDDLSLDAFLDLNEMTFKRRGMSLPYSYELILRLDEACCEHGCRKVFFAEDAQGRLHAAVYIVWDDDSAYYLMSGSDPELRDSGATSLLLWHAIQFAASVTRKFDFEGSMIESVERHFRSFGARQKPYLQVSKINSLLLKMYRDARSWLRLLRG